MKTNGAELQDVLVSILEDEKAVVYVVLNTGKELIGRVHKGETIDVTDLGFIIHIRIAPNLDGYKYLTYKDIRNIVILEAKASYE